MLSLPLIILATIIAIQLFYYAVIFTRFSFAKPLTIAPKNLPVSVIVCAKNEAENCKNFIPLLAEQKYSNFEIVLIDDASSDGTLEVFEDFEKKYSNIKLVKVANNETFWGNKKYALTLGIKAASKEYLLFIDADCYPNSENWITEMCSQFTSTKSIVIGYGKYEKIKNSLLNKLIRFETLMTALQYFSWAKLGKPYMGVGRNLGYKKEVFFNINGFINHIKLRSGDDDLFINEAANSENTSIIFSQKSFTLSKPKTTFFSWLNQKRRHISTATHYKLFDKLQLGLFYISQLSFIVLSTLLLAFQFNWEIVLGLISFRYIFAWIIVYFTAKKLDEKDIILWFPFIEIVIILIQFYLFLHNLFSKPVHWK